MSLLGFLSEVGVSTADIEQAMVQSAAVKVAVIEKANAVKDYWQSIAPVSDRPAHKIYSATNNPGDYRDSIYIKYERMANGFSYALVGTKYLPLATWLEYGSVHNPEFGYAQKVVDAMGGKVLGSGPLEGYLVSS